MSLRELILREEYRSDTSDVVTDFYEPCLAVSSTYDRAVGYFTSDGLALAARGLKSFEVGGGRMRLVASPILREEDFEAIRLGLAQRNELVEARLLEGLSRIEELSASAVLLCELVATDRLKVRIAVPRAGPGIYHEKCGIFRDAQGAYVAFSGSANETVGGLVRNFEAIDIFFSWDGTATRAKRKVENFDRLWEDQTPGLDVMQMPEAVRRKVIEVATARGSRSGGRPRQTARTFESPPGFLPRPYQVNAVGAWFDSDCRGILSMATGTGKTETALAAAARLGRQLGGGFTILVLCPYKNLVNQWADKCDAWGLKTIRCFESAADWRPAVEEAVDTLLAGGTRPLCLVSTYATAQTAAFTGIVGRLTRRPVLLIADEVHHLGADSLSGLLHPEFAYRLGLSATPSRWKDEVGTETLLEYFSGVVFEFTIGDAIQAGYLCPYRYEPVVVRLEQNETEAYAIVAAELEELLRKIPLPRDRIRGALNRRAQILDTALGKVRAFRDDLRSVSPNAAIVYCASRSHLGVVADVLRDEGILPRPFTDEESAKARADLLDDFTDGRVRVILAMHALDEGVDVPSARELHILASSANPREFVQRRGRVLRPHPGKTHARIVDYVAIPDDTSEGSRRVTQREVQRVLDFSKSAMNSDAARGKIWGLLDRFDLLHLAGEFVS
jgi:superfamily II DNA or RNA helicase